MAKLLEEIIEEQITVEFTGKIQLLHHLDYSSLGYISFKDGRILDAKFENKTGDKAFISAMIHEKRCKMIIEAEFGEQKKTITKNYRQLIEAFEEALINHKYYEHFSVPAGIKLKVNPGFIQRGSSLTHSEYAVLLGLAKTGYENLFRDLNMLDYEITKNLISLRKKGALKTVAKRSEIRL